MPQMDQESVAVHAVDELGITEAVSGARPVEEVRHTAHALGSSRQHVARFPRADVLGGEDDRLEPRAARLVHGERDPFLWNARLHEDLARRVRAPARLPRVSIDQLVDVARRYVGAFESGARRGNAQLRRGDFGEGAEKTPDGCADSGKNSDAFHGRFGRALRRR